MDFLKIEIFKKPRKCTENEIIKAELDGNNSSNKNNPF